jgi:prepilin-type N-terminal cleavage/methylation domain-containing protein
MKKADGKAAFSARGFTLLEILVALGIAAIAIVLVLDSLLLSTFRTGYLRDRTFASWIGHNQMADDPDLGFVTIVGFLGLPTPRSNNPGWVLRPGAPPPTDGGQRPGNGDTT